MTPSARVPASNLLPAEPRQDAPLDRPETPEHSRKVAPLSWEQEQIWLHGKLFPDSPLYAETLVIRYRGVLNSAALEQSLSEICKRHEIWRTTIEEHHGTPRQVVGEPAPIRIASFDLTIHPEASRELHVDWLLRESRRQPFDLARGPLIRVFTVRDGPGDTRIFLTLHHLIFDGASVRQIVLPELVQLYAAFCAGETSPLPPQLLQYADYASRQKTKPLREAAMAFWRANLASLSSLHLPADRARSAQTGRPGGVYSFRFEEALAGDLIHMARRERTTPFSILFASFVVLLARSCDTEDVTVGTSYGGRASTELEGVLGCFLNTLLLRTDLTGDPSFRELLGRVRGVTLDALENADVPFQEVIRDALLRTSLTESPVQAVFAFQPPSADLPPEWDLDVFRVFNGCAKFDLHLEVEQLMEHQTGGFRGRLMYSTDLFDAGTIQAFYRHWIALLRAAVQAPETCIWKLPMLDAAEQEWLLHGVNPSQADLPQLCVHDLFTRTAAEVPGSPAISFQQQTVSYQELEQSSARIAARLRELSLGTGSVIGLMMERSPQMVAALLGILRAGAAYVPLDPTYPAARLEHMIRASGAALLLTETALLSMVPKVHPPVLNVAECLQDSLGGSALAAGLPQVSLDATAYILFTSGSTGVPKGVEISHSGLTNLLESMRRRPGIAASDVLVAVTSISFDISALELYLPLIAGARVELASVEEATDPKLLALKLRQSGATMLQATPATWRMLVEDGWRAPRPMKLLCGGEALSATLARQLLERNCSTWNTPGPAAHDEAQECSTWNMLAPPDTTTAQECSTWNMYGPTETTIWSACSRIEPGFSQIGLGAPVANTSLFILDRHGTLLPAGVAGELYIGGAGLAKGYVGQPELTRERFPVVSLGEAALRLYRTGDRVKRLRDGSLVFLGRTDRQIKLHGFRIELGEIEQVLNSLPGVLESIVVQTQHAGRGELLAGFVVPKAGASLRTEELRLGLAKILPRYMQPATLQILTEVPLTLNGKLDRSRLPAPSVEPEGTASDQPRPGTEQTLAAIWCDLLSLQTVGRRDNFFDLGGHSLLAVRFLSSAGQAFGREFPFDSLIQAPTIAQFALIVQGEAVPHTLLLKRGSPAGQQADAKQLVWIGMEPWLTRLARHLDEDVTLVAITPDLAAVAEDPSQRGIEALAARVLSHLRDLQPQGPYLLGGFCLRSLLAYEVAQQLQRAGQQVALLVLGDLYAPGRRPRWTRLQRILRRVHRESCNLSAVIRLPAREWAGKLRPMGAIWMRLLVNQAADPKISSELLDSLYAAERHYRPTPYTGRVLFLESGESRLFQGSTSTSWQSLLGEVEVFRYPGIHETVLNDPHLGLAAREIQLAIDRALSTERSMSHQPVTMT